MIRQTAKDLGNLVLDQQYVAPMDLAAAIADATHRKQLASRIRPLIRDRVAALKRTGKFPQM